MTPSLTFVCCIESGPLEFQTTRLVRSIRKWGGDLANCPILAVTPRTGCPLHPETVRLLAESGVRHVKKNVDDPYRWFGYLNKCKALELAETEADTDQIVWVDSDVLIVAQPDDLLLEDGVDIAACPTSKTVATEGPGDPNESYWQALCELFDISLDQLGWTTTVDKNEKIRGYYNSGVVPYRRGIDFGEAYRAANMKALLHGPVHPEAGIFYLDQIALALQVAQSNLRLRELKPTHNLTMRPELEYPDEAILASTSIIHYRGSMWPDSWPRLLELLDGVRPDVTQWLREIGPLTNGVNPLWRVTNKVVNKYRGNKRAKWESAR